MTQIMAVSKAGVNVLTATDPNDFIFNSIYNTFKILATGTFNVSFTGDPFLVESCTNVAHGLSGTPLVMGFMLMADSRATTPGNVSSDGNTTFFYNLRSDGTNIRVCGASLTTVTRTIRYYIFEPPL